MTPNSEKVFTVSSYLLIVGLLFSKFLISASMIVLLCLALYAYFNKNYKNPSSPFLKSFQYSGFLLIPLVIALSFFNSENTDNWLKQVVIKIPFLIYPFIFWQLGKSIDHKLKTKIHWFFIAMVTLTAVGVLINYAIHYHEINQAMTYGTPIPTPIDHIHFSILLSYAVVLGILTGIFSKNENERKLAYGSAIIGFIILHILAVRSGIMVTYLSAFVLLVYYVRSTKKYRTAIGFAAAFLVLVPLSYYSMPSLKQKVKYMLYDLEQFGKGKGNNYSDSERLMSYQIALELIQDRPLLGHGIGDIKPIMIKKHKELFGEKERYIKPHNQYLFIMVGIGIIGFCIFFFGLLSPYVFAPSGQKIFLIITYAVLLSAFLVENTIQRSVMTSFAVYFILLHLPSQCNPSDRVEPSNR